MINESIMKVIEGEELSQEEMEKTMELILDAKVPSLQVGSFVTALRMRGETVEEITGAARALRKRATMLRSNNHILSFSRDDINVERETVLATTDNEIRGTSIFNVSTATMFVVSGGGVRVVRQGNMAASKYFGAGDVLESLGVNLDVSNSDVESCISELGIGFLFRPLLSGPMQNVAELREEMGIRTIFNLIGPLVNPAGASTYILGVYDASLTEILAHVLSKLAADNAFVVYGEDTQDEISICGSTTISRLINGKVQTRVITPEEYGFKRATHEAIAGGNAKENAAMITSILDGNPSSRRDIVVFNAAAAFVASGCDGSLEDGIKRAEEAIDSGKAKKKLQDLIEFTGKCKPFVRKIF